MTRTWWQAPSGQAAKVPGKDECKSLLLAMFFQVVVLCYIFVVTFHRNVCSCLAQEQIIARTIFAKRQQRVGVWPLLLINFQLPAARFLFSMALFIMVIQGAVAMRLPKWPK